MLEQMNGNFEYDNFIITWPSILDTIIERIAFSNCCMYVCLAKGKELGGFVDKIIRIDLLRKKAWNGIKELKIEKYMLRKIHDASQQSLAKQTTSNQGSMRMTLRRIHPCGNETHGLDAWQMNHRSSTVFWWRMIINILNCSVDRNSIFSNEIEECEMQIFCVQM